MMRGDEAALLGHLPELGEPRLGLPPQVRIDGERSVEPRLRAAIDAKDHPVAIDVAQMALERLPRARAHSTISGRCRMARMLTSWTKRQVRLPTMKGKVSPTR
jgi:hypothetical protein